MQREKNDLSILLIQVLLTMENGKVDSEMDKEHRHGQMELCIQGNGTTIEHKVKVNLCILTVMSTKATGSMIRLTDMEYTITLMELSMKDNGWMTFSTEKEKKAGKMVLFSKETTVKERSMESVTTVGMMEASILVTGTKTKSMDLVLTVG